MATLFDWGDGKGKVHTKSLSDHLQALATQQGTIGPAPAGMYDPNLDAQLAAANRQLGDTTADTATQRERLSTDYGLAQTAAQTQRDQLNQDYGTNVAAEGTNYQRSLADLLTQRQQGTEDYQTNLQNLDRSYQILGNQQTGADRNAGAFAGSGAQLQAARKRAANQALDQAPIDTAYQRSTAQSALDEQRLGQDDQTTLANLLTQYQRGGQAIDTGLGQTGLDYQRSNEDLTTQLARAQRENTQFGLDTDTARWAQAMQAGASPTMIPRALTPAEQAQIAYTKASPLSHITAAPGIGTTKKKGRTLTYSNSVSAA
jgi:hypothetical protein